MSQQDLIPQRSTVRVGLQFGQRRWSERCLVTRVQGRRFVARGQWFDEYGRPQSPGLATHAERLNG
jgi:hypothetical protein